MDFKAILPLLLAGNKGADKIMPILSAMSNGKERGEQNAYAAQSEDKNVSPLDAVLGDKNPAMAQLLKNAMSDERNKTGVYGIEQIVGIANDEILGKMVKYIMENSRSSIKKGKRQGF